MTVGLLRSTLGHSVFKLNRSTRRVIAVHLLASGVVINPWTLKTLGATGGDTPLFLLIYDAFVAGVAAALVGLPDRCAIRVRVWHLLGITAVSIVALEVLFRIALFVPSVQVPILEAPGLYADSDSQDDYWVLYHYFSRAEYKTPAEPVDPELGWVSSNGGSLGSRSPQYREIGDVAREPILFFGDSYVAGHDARLALPQLLEAEMPSFSVLNYGVGGYGTDQIALRTAREAGRFPVRPRFTLVGVMLRDMDRSLLRFRVSQKPFYTIEDTPALHRPAFALNTDFIKSYRFSTRSFLWAAINRVTRRALGRPDGDSVRRLQINRVVFRELAIALREAGLPSAIVILYSRADLQTALQRKPVPRELELRSIVTETGLRLIDTKAALIDALQRRECRFDELFLPDDHYTVKGNRIVAKGLASALCERNHGSPDEGACEL